jgi:hypothetical protein
MLNKNKIKLHQLTIKFNMVSEQVLKMTVAQFEEPKTSPGSRRPQQGRNPTKGQTFLLKFCGEFKSGSSTLLRENHGKKGPLCCSQKNP